MIQLRLISLLLSLACTNIAAAQFQNQVGYSHDPTWGMPVKDMDADPDIPDLEKVVGFRWGADHTDHHQIQHYLRALADAAPERTRLVEYGKSYEGRSLYYLVISSASNINRLDQIQANIGRLADPRTLDPVEANHRMESTPAIVWLAYCVHGNEPSTSDAALLTAWHLLADRREATRAMLDQLVVIIDPLQNPDGRERFVGSLREARGAFPQAYPIANEHTERWPLGRTNHYWFDMNRDWFRQSQKESRAKVAAYLQWHPQIYCDSHEFSLDKTYHFSPPHIPINPYILPHQLEWMDQLGRHQAQWFDRSGFAYTTREMFDAFYPGYGSEWPTMQGGIGVLWEQAGSRGELIDKQDGTILNYRQGVRHNYISGLATLEFAAQNSRKLVEGFYKSRERAIQLGSEGNVQHYFILNDQPQRAAEMASLLRRNGIEVRRVDEAIQLEVTRIHTDQKSEQIIPAGTYHLPASQGAGRLLKTLMDRNTPMDEAYLQKQIERVLKKQKPEFADVSSWSLPLSFDVESLHSGKADIKSSIWNGQSNNFQNDFDRAEVAYVIPESDGAIRLAMALMHDLGVRIHVAEKPFRIGERDFARGSFLIRARDEFTQPHPATDQDERDMFHYLLLEVAKSFDVEVVPVDSGYVTSGAHFGGPSVAHVPTPKILLVVNEPTLYTSGHTWHLFDEHFRFPTTRVKGSDLSRVKLSDFTTIILPDGKYKDFPGFDQKLADRLSAWVADGGTLITLKGATEWAIKPEFGLIKNGLVRKTVATSGNHPDGKMSEEVAPEKVLGAFFGASVDQDHWITFGIREHLPVFYTGNVILTPTGETEGRTLVSFNPKESLVASGFCWPESETLLASSPYLVYRQHGRGHVVAFTDDPNFRAMYPGLQRLFINAVLFGPAKVPPILPTRSE